MPMLPNKKKPAHKILAIDPATNCGWAISTDIYGVWNLKPKRDESIGMRLIRLRSKLKEVCEAEEITIIVFERPGGRHQGAIITQSELQAIIKTFCEDNSLEYKAYSSTEIKKYATGKGNCNKQAMIDAAKSQLGYKGDNDNEADALWLLQLGKSDLGL